LIELHCGRLGNNLRKQQALRRGKVDHAQASPVSSNTVQSTGLQQKRLLASKTSRIIRASGHSESDFIPCRHPRYRNA
jgi:hypothetical protein